MLYVLIATNVYFAITFIIRRNHRKQNEMVSQSIISTLKESNEKHHEEMMRFYESKSKDASYMWYLRNLLNQHAIEHQRYEEFDPVEWHKKISGQSTRK